MRMKENWGKVLFLKILLVFSLIFNNFSGIIPIIHAFSEENITGSVNVEGNSEVKEEFENPEQTPGTGDGVENPEQTPGTGDGVESPEQTPGTEDGVENPEQTPGTGDGVESPEQTPETGDGVENPEQTPGTGDGVENPEQTPGTEDEVQASEGEELNLLSEDSSLYSSKPKLVQFWQYPACGAALHYVYDSPSKSAKQITYFSAQSVDDAVYLDETEDYFQVYFSGVIGWVKKNDWKTCNGKDVLLTAEPRSVLSTKATDELSLQENPSFEITDINQKLKSEQFYSEENHNVVTQYSSGLQYQDIKVAYSPSYYININGDLWHYTTTNIKNPSAVYGSFKVGKAPKERMEENRKYYSYDGVYFYDNLNNISPDGVGSVNEDKPFYNYYQYLPMRSKSNITEQDFYNYLSQKGYTQPITQEDKNILGTPVWENEKMIAVNLNCNYNGGKWTDPNSGKPCISSNKSMLVGTYSNFLNTENVKGVNAIYEAVWAMHESGNGRSTIGIFKNNLFGMGATDNEAFKNAYYYDRLTEGLNDHVDSFVNQYLYSSDWRYFGPHLGDKGSGMNVKYASDPFWGEKIAGYYYDIDKFVGLKDYNYYSIGIKQGSSIVNVKQQPNTSSKTLYSTKNTSGWGIRNYPVLITGKSGDFYKVKTDSMVDSAGNLQKTGQYDWSTTYGYIDGKDIIIANHSSFTDPYSAGDLDSHAESVIFENGKLVLHGWAYIEGTNMNNNSNVKKYAIIKDSNGQEVKRSQLDNVYSKDISDWKNSNYDYARYNGVVDISDLNLGQYNLYIEVQVGDFIRQKELTSNFLLSQNIGYDNGIGYITSNDGPGTIVILSVKDVQQETHVDTFNVQTNGSLYLYGWTTLDGLDMNNSNKFSRQIIIKDKSGKEVQRVKVTPYYSTDLSDWNNKKQNYARFEATLDIKNLPVGEYDFYVELTADGYTKTSQLNSNFSYSKKTTYINGKEYVRYNSGTKTPLKLSVKDVQQETHVDTFNVQTNGSLYLYGWTTLDGLDMNNSNKFSRQIIIKDKSGKEVQRVKVTPYYSTDLSDWNNKKQNYARFEATLDIKNLPVGEYDFYVELTADGYTKTSQLNSNFSYSKKSTYINGKEYVRYNSGVKTPLKLSVKDVQQETHVDTFNVQTNGSLYLYGWTTLDGLDMNNSNKFSRQIIIKDKSGKEVQRVKVTPYYSTDLSDWNNKKQNYARFEATLDIKNLPVGEYDFYVELTADGYTKTSQLNSNFSYSKKSTYINGKEYVRYNSGVKTPLKLSVKDVQQETHVDTFNVQTNGSLYLYGWTTLDGLDMNNSNKFSRQIIIKDKSGKEVQRVKVTPYYSTDLSDWNNKKQNYARFEATLDIKNLPVGEYDFYVELTADGYTKTSQLNSNFSYSKKTTYINGKEYVRYNSGTKTPLKLSVKDVQQETHVDTFNVQTNGSLYLYGWTTLDGLDMNNSNKFSRQIIIKDKSGKEVQRVKVTPYYSTDLSDWNNKKQNYARFEATLDIKNLPVGEYDFYVELTADGYTKTSQLNSNFSYSKKSTYINGKEYVRYNSGAKTVLKLEVK